MAALLLLSYICIVTVNVQWRFITVPWFGLQCVSVVFPDHTPLLLVHLNNDILTARSLYVLY